MTNYRRQHFLPILRARISAVFIGLSILGHAFIQYGILACSSGADDRQTKIAKIEQFRSESERHAREGNLEAAITAMRQVLEIERSVFGDKHQNDTAYKTIKRIEPPKTLPAMYDVTMDHKVQRKKQCATAVENIQNTFYILGIIKNIFFLIVHELIQVLSKWH